MKQNILVFGSGRSGTSLMMSILGEESYFMGDNLYFPSDSNPTGFFESNDINQLNESLLGKVVPPRYVPKEEVLYNFYPRIKEFLLKLNFRKRVPVIEQRWLSRVPLSTSIKSDRHIDQRIKSLVNHTPFCFKDPRFSYTLPSWIPFLNIDNTYFIVMYRHPHHTVQSILKECSTAEYLKNKIDIDFSSALEVWNLMYEHIFHNMHYSDNWIFVHYEQILDKSIAPILESKLGIQVDLSAVDESYWRSRKTGEMDSRTTTNYEKLKNLSNYP